MYMAKIIEIYIISFMKHFKSKQSSRVSYLVYNYLSYNTYKNMTFNHIILNPI